MVFVLSKKLLAKKGTFRIALKKRPTGLGGGKDRSKAVRLSLCVQTRDLSGGGHRKKVDL